jgi:hypothetical protein
MAGVLSNLAVERLEKLGMRKVRIPLGTGETEPHTVVLVSSDFDLNTEKVVVLVSILVEGVDVDSVLG